MKKNTQSGEINVLLIPLILVVLLLFGAAYFGYWAYNGRQDYKNNTDQKIAAAVAVAQQETSTAKDKAFTEQEKSPVKTYTGPQADGSVVVQYPKTWSAYVDASGNSGSLLDAFFAPNVVPAENSDQSTVYSLRMQVIQEPYSQVVQEIGSSFEPGQAKVVPYKLPKVPGVVGIRVTGQIQPEKKGTMIVLPIRGNTLEVWTESDTYIGDFNKYILPNLSFSP